MGFLLATLSYQVLLVIIFVYLGFYSFGFQLCLEDAPLAFRPSVEFWIRLPLHKAQVHVVIALGMICDTSTKPPPTIFFAEIIVLKS